MALIDTLCIELTARCPLRCVHCSANAAPGRFESLPARLLVEQLGLLGGLREIYLSGGEPFEHPELEQVVQAAARVAPVVVAYTSGTAWREGGIEPLSEQSLRAAREAGLTRADFSVYAAESGAHDAVTLSPGSFEATRESLRRARAVGLGVGVHFVSMRGNAHELERVAQLAREEGAERLHVLGLRAQGRASQRAGELEPSPDFLPLLAGVAAREAARMPVVISRSLRHALGQLQPTERDAHRTAFIDVEGFVYPGEGCRTPAYRTAGSLLRGQRLDELLAQVEERRSMLPGA
jgi:MoaA/NifB/PqqE/SkfB family radical SAM enzyme